MAIRKLQGIKVGRLIVLILLFAIPAAFILIVVGSELDWFGPIISWEMFTTIGPLPFLPEGWAKFMVWFGAPVFFSLPWVTFLFIDKNRVAEAFDNMGRALRKVSIGLNIFYTVNVIFILTFLIIPFGSPAIAVLASFGLIPWIVRKKTGARIPWWIAIIPGILLGAIPTILAVGFYANSGPVLTNIWTIWTGGAATGTLLERFGWVHVLYGFGYSLAVGAVIAGFVSFIYEGASQVDRWSERPKGILYIVEFLVAAGIFVLYMMLDVENPARNIVFYIISGISVGLGLLEFLLRWFKKTKRHDEDNVPMGAYVMLPLFIAVDFIRAGNVEQIKNYALTISLALASIIYFVLFILAYSFAGETYPSRWSRSKDDDDEDDDSSDEE